MHCRIVDPSQTLFEGEVGFVTARSIEGELGITAGHAPLMTLLSPGPVALYAPGAGVPSAADGAGENESSVLEIFFVEGGMLEVSRDSVTILADAAGHAESISAETAAEQQAQAQKMLRDSDDAVDYERLLAEVSIASARMRALELQNLRKRGGRNS